MPEKLLNIDELKEQLDIKQSEFDNLISSIPNRGIDNLIKELNELKSIQNRIVQEVRKDIDLQKEKIFNELKNLKEKNQKLNMHIFDLDSEKERLIKDIENTKKEKEILVIAIPIEIENIKIRKSSLFTHLNFCVYTEFAIKKQGYKVVVAYGIDELIKVLMEYIKNKNRIN